MMLLKIALRNILRNRRRSIMTISAIAVGALAMLLFGAFTIFSILGTHTGTVERAGHLVVLRTGYFNFGTGNPAAYGIPDYEKVMDLIKTDAVVGPMARVVTAGVSLFGIAGNFAVDSSRTFVGTGVVPSDRSLMRSWDEYHVGRGLPAYSAQLLTDDDVTRGVIGIGLARTLGLCAPLHIPDCPAMPTPPSVTVADAAAPPDVADLASRDKDPPSQVPDRGMPRIDLLSATAGGAPNVLSLYVSGTDRQAVKELDDSYVGMHLALAQQLVYGRGEHKATSIVIQLNRSEDMGAARARLNTLFKEKGLDLEVHDFAELNPIYKQIIAFFGAIFSFISVIMAVIVLFTVVNTMSMSVMERVNEIGTTRALGVKRRGIRRQFLAEGAVLGVIGATAGAVLAIAIATLVNRAGLTWTPPGQSGAVPLRLVISVPALVVGTWLVLTVIATIASLIPASRAARMPVVDALRHV